MSLSAKPRDGVSRYRPPEHVLGDGGERTLLRKSVDVSEREYGALRRVLTDQPSP